MIVIVMLFSTSLIRSFGYVNVFIWRDDLMIQTMAERLAAWSPTEIAQE